MISSTAGCILEKHCWTVQRPGSWNSMVEILSYKDIKEKRSVIYEMKPISKEHELGSTLTFL